MDVQEHTMPAAELFALHDIRISDKTVGKLLRDHGYSLQAPKKSVEGAQLLPCRPVDGIRGRLSDGHRATAA
jgi:hypothetical protein